MPKVQFVSKMYSSKEINKMLFSPIIQYTINIQFIECIKLKHLAKITTAKFSFLQIVSIIIALLNQQNMQLLNEYDTM